MIFPGMISRRLVVKRLASGLGMGWLGYEGVGEFVLGRKERELAMGFHNDAPSQPDAFSRPAAYGEPAGRLVRCTLCPHACTLGEGDRGLCRVRAVKGGRLLTLGYGNLCSMAMDPIEKKPLYHFLPRTPILSVAMGGCNLRCLNCQNWEISQARPEDVKRLEALPERLVQVALQRGAPSIAFTYTEPLVTFEYVRDASQEARRKGVRTVLVTAGFVQEKPLRELCRSIDAVTLDVKAFRDSFYREVSSARLAPVLRTLEVLREEGVWIEVSFLMVPTLSDEPSEVGAFAAWVAEKLGPETPLHILRFHPAHRLTHLPPTPLHALQGARQAATGAGLRHVYVGNAPGSDGGRTRCAGCGRALVEREGFRVVADELRDGACPACGRKLSGVFS